VKLPENIRGKKEHARRNRPLSSTKDIPGTKKTPPLPVKNPTEKKRAGGVTQPSFKGETGPEQGQQPRWPEMRNKNIAAGRGSELSLPRAKNRGGDK